MITLKCGDCLQLMQEIPSESINLILCDLPYGTTACSWDTIIPLDKLWEQYTRIIRDNGTTILFGTQPFTTQLINSNFKTFRYCLVWDKIKGSNILMGKKMPLKSHEDIIVFYKKQPTFNPQKTFGEKYDKRKFKSYSNTMGFNFKRRNANNGERYPLSILHFSKNWQPQQSMHPTQKPVALMEYLIKTYTNEGDIVLDNCMGSGTTGVACINTNRNFIGFELNEEYFKVAKERIEGASNQASLLPILKNGVSTQPLHSSDTPPTKVEPASNGSREASE